MDTGGGLRPDPRSGQGWHTAWPVPPSAFRVTVAAFNLRALRVIQGLGFSEVARFEATTNGRSYVVLVGTSPYGLARPTKLCAAARPLRAPD